MDEFLGTVMGQGAENIENKGIERGWCASNPPLLKNAVFFCKMIWCSRARARDNINIYIGIYVNAQIENNGQLSVVVGDFWVYCPTISRKSGTKVYRSAKMGQKCKFFYQKCSFLGLPDPLLIRVLSLALAVGRCVLSIIDGLAISSQDKLAPSEPDRASQNNPLDIRPAGFCYAPINLPPTSDL